MVADHEGQQFATLIPVYGDAIDIVDQFREPVRYLCINLFRIILGALILRARVAVLTGQMVEGRRDVRSIGAHARRRRELVGAAQRRGLQLQ